MDKKYALLFNAITDAITELDSIKECLVAIQQTTEEIYVSEEI